MGVDVTLMQVTQRGTSPKGRRLSPLAAVVDRDDVIVWAFRDSGRPMLARVDPYGDLILSRAEMDQFIAEAESLASGTDEAAADRIR